MLIFQNICKIESGYVRDNENDTQIANALYFLLSECIA